MRKKIVNKCKLCNRKIVNLKMKRKKEDNPQDQDNMHPQQGYLSWEGISSPSIKIQDVVQLLGLKEKAWIEVF